MCKRISEHGITEETWNDRKLIGPGADPERIMRIANLGARGSSLLGMRDTT